MAVYLLKHACPAGHIITGLAYDTDRMPEQEAREALANFLVSMQINPWCGLCGSRDLKTTQSPTEYKSMTEANTAFQELQKAEIAYRNAMDKSGRSFDSQRHLNN